MGRGSRMATLASTTPAPSPTRAHSAGRPELETAGWEGGGSQHRVGDSALRERGPPKPVPGLGSHTRLVPGAVRLRATLKAFRAAPPGCQARLLHWIKAAEASQEWVSMTSSKILGMYRLSPLGLY